MTKRFITVGDATEQDLSDIYHLARTPFDDETLKGQGVALVFERPSLRTRASSSAAVHELGGYATFFGADEVGLDERESAEDIGRTLAEMFAICALRVRDHGVFERIWRATGGRLALINLLSDVAHPTQAVADALTIADEFSRGDLTQLAGLEVAYVGDATNVARSLAVCLLRAGVNVRVGAPAGYQLTPSEVENPFAVTGGGTLRLFSNAAEAVRGANVIYTDSWVSMGFESEVVKRREELAEFRVDEELVTRADANAIVMHCLPAHRGDEVTNSVLDGPRSRVWRQVHHRHSAMMGVLRWMKEEK